MVYVGLVGAPLVGLVMVLRSGPAFEFSRPVHDAYNADSVPSVGAGVPNLALLIAQIGLIIACSRALGFLAERIRQPRVIGEMLAGIMLGPSLLGWVAPGLSSFLFPPASFTVLNALSQLGLALFMFMVGLELNWNEVRRNGGISILIGHASIAVPIALGTILALVLYPQLSDRRVGFTEFALFIGLGLSVTAFPVLARILSERKLLRTRVGAVALACAAVVDITGWCLLAYIVAIVRASDSAFRVWTPICGLLVFVAIMFFGVRPLLRKAEFAYRLDGELSENWQALLLLLILISALATESLGLHVLFGAFVAGVVMPKGHDFVSYVAGKFESLTVLLLLPLFFAYSGLRTRLGQVNGFRMWWLWLLIVFAAVVGKVAGTCLAARIGGLPWRESAALGVLMNTRGVMELAILNIGLDIGVISRPMFSMMVLMAVVTTMMTRPLLDWVFPSSLNECPMTTVSRD